MKKYSNKQIRVSCVFVIFTTLLIFSTLQPIFATNTVIATIPIGDDPLGMAYDPINNRIYVANSAINNVSVIDASSNTVIANISVPGNPRDIAYDSVNQRMYVAKLTGGVRVIDTSTNTATTNISISGNHHGIAYDSVNQRMYVTSSGAPNRVDVIDTSSNTVTANISIGSNSPQDIAYDSVNQRMYVAPVTGDVKVIDTSSNTVITTISVASSSEGIAYDSVNQRMYVSNDSPNSISVIDTSNNTVITTIFGGTTFEGIAYDSVNQRMYVTDRTQNNVSVIDVSSNTIIETISVGTGPEHITYDPINQRMYVSNRISDNVSVIDVAVSTGGSGDSKWKTKPTFGLSHQTFAPLVESGFSVNGKSFDIIDNWHTDFERQTIKIGERNSFTAKAYSEKGLEVVKFMFGIPKVGESHNAEAVIEVLLDIDLNVVGFNLIQKDNLIDKDSIKVSDSRSNCTMSDSDNRCVSVMVSAIFNESPLYDVFALEGIDTIRQNQITYLNEGFDIIGDSLNPPKTQMVASDQKGVGLKQMTLMDKRENIWKDSSNVLYQKNQFGSFLRITPHEIASSPESPKNVMTRENSNFNLIKQYEIVQARHIFDSSLIQKEPPKSYSIVFSERQSRDTNAALQNFILEEESKAEKTLSELWNIWYTEMRQFSD